MLLIRPIQCRNYAICISLKQMLRTGHGVHVFCLESITRQFQPFCLEDLWRVMCDMWVDIIEIAMRWSWDTLRYCWDNTSMFGWLNGTWREIFRLHCALFTYIPFIKEKKSKQDHCSEQNRKWTNHVITYSYLNFYVYTIKILKHLILGRMLSSSLL